jgi:hypothetical protein
LRHINLQVSKYLIPFHTQKTNQQPTNKKIYFFPNIFDIFQQIVQLPQVTGDGEKEVADENEEQAQLPMKMFGCFFFAISNPHPILQSTLKGDLVRHVRICGTL